MNPLTRQWHALSIHDRYAVAMFTVLFVVPGLALLGLALGLLWTAIS